jgi:hypothetical protein
MGDEFKSVGEEGPQHAFLLKLASIGIKRVQLRIHGTIRPGFDVEFRSVGPSRTAEDARLGHLVRPPNQRSQWHVDACEFSVVRRADDVGVTGSICDVLMNRSDIEDGGWSANIPRLGDRGVRGRRVLAPRGWERGDDHCGYTAEVGML